MLTFLGDSDAHIVRGLVAIMLALFSGRRASEIVSTDAEAADALARARRASDAAARQRLAGSWSSASAGRAGRAFIGAAIPRWAEPSSI